MLWSGLLIHLTGGRIETHFHVFGSLALLAFYLDWRVLATATIVTTIDHAIRGILWPMSIYGVATGQEWRFAEHAWWVLFEVMFLTLAIFNHRKELLTSVEHKTRIEAQKREVEKTVQERTAELLTANNQLTTRTLELEIRKLELQKAL